MFGKKDNEAAPAAVAATSEQLVALRTIVMKELANRQVYQEAASALDAIDLLESTVDALRKEEQALNREVANLEILAETEAKKVNALREEGVKAVEAAQAEASKILADAIVAKSTLEQEAAKAVHDSRTELALVTGMLEGKKDSLAVVTEDLAKAQAALDDIRAKAAAI